MLLLFMFENKTKIYIFNMFIPNKKFTSDQIRALWPSTENSLSVMSDMMWYLSTINQLLK